MKSKALRNLLFILLPLFPVMVQAQWSQVRWDHLNYFMKGYAISPNSFIATGVSPGWDKSFVVRTNDGGATWDSIPVGTSASVYQLNSLHFTDLNNGYAGGALNVNQALVKTTDNGNTWSDVTPDTLSNYPINGISFIDAQNGYVSDHLHIYKTNNGGANWTTLNPNMYIGDISFLDMNSGYLSGSLNSEGVIFKTSDGGQTWSNLLTLINPFSGTLTMENLDVISDDVIFSCLPYNSSLYRTTDGGINWDTIPSPSLNYIQDYDFINANEGHILTYMSEIYSTVDGGQNWTLEYSVAGGFYGPSVYLNSISFDGSTGYVCGSEGLIKKYTVGVTGIASSSSNKNISIYPNPLNNKETLTINGVEGNCKVEIFNTSGQLMFTKEITVEEGKQLHLEQLNLSPGLYTASIVSNENKYSFKLVSFE
ncbi:MAG: YCF48-related protein [Bacteroidota bacterium]